jgi:hypothetical protein
MQSETKQTAVVLFIPGIKEKAGVYRYCFEFLKNLLRRDVEIHFYCLYFPDNLLVGELR